MAATYFVGVDVGTSSARAALVSRSGDIVTSAVHPVRIFEPEDGLYEQSSEDIWNACCKVVRVSDIVVLHLCENKKCSHFRRK